MDSPREVEPSEADGALQYKWRTEVVQFDTKDGYRAVIAALQLGGVDAWCGDGTGMVVQMLENVYGQRDRLQAEVAALKERLEASERDAAQARARLEWLYPKIPGNMYRHRLGINYSQSSEIPSLIDRAIANAALARGGV